MFSRTGILIYGVVLTSLSTLAIDHAKAQGWEEVSNTRLQSVCAGANGFPQVLGATGCAAITVAWSGAIFDSRRDRLIIWGGGHNDYYGNELYAFNVQSSTIERLNDPGLPTSAGCTESIANGTQPNSRHTYDGIEYIEATDEMFVFGGSLACGAGDFGSDTWTYDFKANRWQQRSPSGPIPRGDAGMLTAYDPVTGLVYVHDRQHLYSFDSRNNRYTRLSSSPVSLGYHLAATIDPVRRVFLIVGFDSAAGSGAVYSYDIDQGSSYAMRRISTSGGGPVINAVYPGVDFDKAAGQVVGWSGNSVNSVFSLDLGKNEWNETAYSGGPVAVGNGTHGRWRYSAASGVFVLANRVNDNIFVLRTGAGELVRPNPPASLKSQ
ncbi:MAG: hypothetical protein DRR42_10600 [Gammaproteobacteria bacterium]|nr:MAG: hypothetical protein DRR42_10600 [Gammaproteobacteria bacterium]